MRSRTGIAIEHTEPVIEFESEIGPGGTIRLSGPIAARMEQGTRVTVRLTRGVPGADLRARGVTEEEIEQIAVLQLEPRAQVMRFLRAEGAVKGNRKFRLRAARLMRGKR